jgi:c-di-GMP-binding flagellar brake protein YcgR
MEQERRKYKRVPAISVVKEALIESPVLNLKEQIPAIISNLSAGGMAVITFLSLPLNATISLNFNIDGLKLKDVEGKVVRVEGKRKIFLIVIAFTKIRAEVKNRINMMADALDLCETRILMGEENVCSTECAYYRLCNKSIKLATDKYKN